MNVMRMMMTSNAGETDQAEFSPFPPPQTGALPSHHHLLFMITIWVDYDAEDEEQVSGFILDLLAIFFMALHILH